MTIFGYARVSTDGQTLDAQVAALKRAGAARVFHEKVSGAKTARRELARLLVITGSRARLSAPTSRICLLGGALSYPIYCLHYQLFCWVNGLYRTRFGTQSIMVEGPLVVVIVLTLSFAALKLYDEPFRRILTNRLKRPDSINATGRLLI